MAILLRTTILLATLVFALSSTGMHSGPALDGSVAQATSGLAAPELQAPVLAVDEDDDHHGMWGDWGSWGWWLFMPMMVIFWGALIWLVVWLVRQSSGRDGSRDGDAVEIARRRYARGEISREEFEQVRHDLGS